MAFSELKILAFTYFCLHIKICFVCCEQNNEIPKPCCFPSAFQATVADMNSVATGQMVCKIFNDDWMKAQGLTIYLNTPVETVPF